MTAEYPWPEDPSALTDDVRLRIRDLSLAALREVCVLTLVEDVGVGIDVAGPGLTHDVFAKALRLSFDALRIPCRAVSPSEFGRLRDSLRPLTASVNPRRWTRAVVGDDVYCELTDTIDPGDEQ